MEAPTPTPLRSLLECIVGPAPTRLAINQFFLHCQQEAVSKLRFNSKAARLMAELGISRLDDLATDALAPVFEQNRDGALPEIQRYFCGYLDWAVLTETQLQEEVKRMIGSVLQDAFFAYHRTIDPSLAKIIRTFKRWISHDPTLTLVTRGKHRFVVCKGTAGLCWSSPTADELAAALLPAMKGRHTPQAALTAVAKLMRTRLEWTAGIKLSTIALAYRASLNALLRAQEKSSQDEADLSHVDLTGLLDHAVTHKLTPLTQKYVREGKMTHSLAGAMQQGVQLRLEATMYAHTSDIDTHFEAFRKVVPGTTRAEYLAQHRNIFEYLHQVTQTHVRDLARERNLITPPAAAE